MKEMRLAALALAAAATLFAAVYLLSVALAPPPPPVQPASVEPPAPVPPVASTEPAAPAEPPPAPPSPIAPPSRRAAVEARIAETPDVAAFFDRLQEVLPADYEAAIEKASAGSAEPSSDSPDFWLSDAVKIVRQSRGALAAKADAAPLSRIFVHQAAVLDALSKGDARLCVDFLYGGASEGFFRFAAENRRLVSGLALAGLDAIADGQAKKIEREPPTDADFGALEAALREKGANDAEIAALLDGKAPEPPLPDERLCTLGRSYLDAMAGLPEATRLRLYALAVTLMARS